ncbi:MAG: aldo/keto reductase, partial [Burkholderiaceae bacterium]|nr:aldo/keto reductase [Burkholderiaceae bacterium]
DRLSHAQALTEAAQAAAQALDAEASGARAQLALAWLLQRAPHIVPIPGTTRVEHLQDDLGAANVRLDAGLVERLEALINPRTVHGNRYAEQGEREVDTETF